MSEASKVTVAGEWHLFASQVGPELLGDRDAAYMWTAGFASALYLMRSMVKMAESKQDFRENMQRLMDEAEDILKKGSEDAG